MKADFSSNDKVVIRFKNRDLRGIIDFSHDEQPILQRVDSPADLPPSPASTGSVPVSPCAIKTSLTGKENV